ncbi:UNKNOWN [Stylonychia lemnae]|uniref:Uncharacterized protein n=1 Tax=Stylonychia lemnae TaxID=5949 RepID=A0A078A1U7_STYLE|nr:UNKNOWN [Stylonychia lemnae]|eukprot:CDW76095.1 UNKNOWN [Stylonychia lemnae]
MFKGDTKQILEGVTQCVLNANFTDVLSLENPDQDQLEIQSFIKKNYPDESYKIQYGQFIIRGMQSYLGAPNLLGAVDSLKLFAREIQLYKLSFNMSGCNQSYPIRTSYLKNAYLQFNQAQNIKGDLFAIVLNGVNTTTNVKNIQTYFDQPDLENTALSFGKLMNPFINMKISGTSMSTQDEKLYFILDKLLCIKGSSTFQNSAQIYNFVKGMGSDFFTSLDQSLAQITSNQTALYHSVFYEMLSSINYLNNNIQSYNNDYGTSVWNTDFINCIALIQGKMINSEQSDLVEKIIFNYQRQSYGELTVNLKSVVSSLCAQSRRR